MYFQKGDFKVLFSLAAPLLLSSFIEASLGFTSNIFLAHLGPTALGAGSLIVWFFATLMVIIWGLFTAVSVLVSYHHGANDNKAVGLVLRDSLGLGILLAIPVSILIHNMSPVLIYLGQAPFVISRALPYLHALSWTVLPDFVSLILLQFIIGLGKTRVNLLFSLTWVPINILLNYLFIFGKLGFPALGIAGLGWGTTASFCLLTIFLFIYLITNSDYRKYWTGLKQATKPMYIKELIKVGLPMGFMFCLEIACFFTITLIMGTIGVNALAANQLAMQYVGFFGALSFAIAQAITVRMSNQLGAGHPDVANRAAYIGIILSVGFTLIVAWMEWFYPKILIGLDFNLNQIHNTAMINMAIHTLAIAAFFQLAESIRISLFGALRALKETKFTLFTSFIGFWCVGILGGYVLDHYFEIGTYSYWYALALGAFFNALLLYWRYRIKITDFTRAKDNVNPMTSAEVPS